MRLLVRLDTKGQVSKSSLSIRGNKQQRQQQQQHTSVMVQGHSEMVRVVGFVTVYILLPISTVVGSGQ